MAHLVVIMEIFGIGPFEFLLIVVLMLLVLGPKEMLATTRKIGTFIRQLIRSPMWGEVMDTSREIRSLPNKIIQEAGLENDIAEIKKTAQAPVQMINDSAKQLTVELEPIQIPKIDIKAIANTPTAPVVMPTPTSPVTQSTSPVIIDATPLDASPLLADFTEVTPPTPSAAIDDGPAQPLIVEIEEFPDSRSLSEQTVPPALQSETVTPLPAQVELPAAEAPKRRTRRAKAPSNGSGENQTTTGLPDPANPVVGQVETADQGVDETPAPELKKRKPRRKETPVESELVIEGLTPHENGRTKGDGA